MILTSTTEAAPFTPPWHCNPDGSPEAGAPTFMLRAGGVIERGQMEADIAAFRAGKVMPYELHQAMQAGVMVLLAGDAELDKVLGAIGAAREAEIERRPLDEETTRLVKQIADVLTEHWPDYADLVGRIRRREQITPILALSRYCTGWSNVKDLHGEPVEFAKGADGRVAEQALSRLQEFDLVAAGCKAYGIQWGFGEAKNSPRPGSSAKDPKTSPAGDTSKAVGRSKARGGRKTPASSSRKAPVGRSRS